jgi:hypothetical protein
MLDPHREEEDNFSSGADASALHILVWVTARGQWYATTLDLGTAFLNAKVVQSEDEDLLLVKPPYPFIDKKFLRKDVLYKPKKAIYGFRQFPKFWGLTCETINGFNIEGEHEGRSMNFVLEPLQSEPDLWKLQNVDDEDNLTVFGLLMTYVDDLLIAAPEPLMLAVQKKSRDSFAMEAKFCDLNENEIEDKEGGEKIKRKYEMKDDRLVNKKLKRLAQTRQVLQLITLAATLSVSKAEEGETIDADRSFSFEAIVIYTLLVIFLTLVL